MLSRRNVLCRVWVCFSISMIVGLSSSISMAADPYNPEAIAKAIAPYLDTETIAVGHVTLANIDAAATQKMVEQVIPLPQSGRAAFAERWGKMTAWKNEMLKAGARDLYAVVSLADFQQDGAYVIVTVNEGANPRAIAGLMATGRADGPTGRAKDPRQRAKQSVRFETCEKLGNVVYCGSRKALGRLKRGPASPRPELVNAFAGAGASAAQFAIIPSADQRRVLAETLPLLSTEVAGGFSWAAVGVNLPPKFSANLIIQSKNPQAAAGIHGLIESGFATLGKLPNIQKQFPTFEEISRLLTPKIDKDRLALVLNQTNQGVNKLLALVSPPIVEAREGARKTQCRNNLKQMALAMHNFHDVYSSFPPSASYNDKGKKLLSWRVFALPFLEQEKLYKEFHLDEPWDSEHNKKLIKKMPAVFACPSADLRAEGKTTYLVPSGTNTVFSGKTGIQIKQITDGTSNTLLIIDVPKEKAVIWTKPDDLNIDAKNALKGLVGQHGEGFYATFCDGSVRFIDRKVPEKQLRALFTRNGEEVID